MVRLARKSLWTSGQGAGDVGWAEVHRIGGEIGLMSPRQKRKRISNERSQSRVVSRQSPGHRAQQ